jgi:hypothetical protein
MARKQCFLVGPPWKRLGNKASWFAQDAKEQLFHNNALILSLVSFLRLNIPDVTEYVDLTLSNEHASLLA